MWLFTTSEHLSCVCVGDISAEIKTEADSNDITLCSDDDKPSTGMFAVSDSRGLVVTRGALPEPSSQLIHIRCIDEEIKSNRTRKPTFTRTKHKPTFKSTHNPNIK